jgi:protein NRD1
MLNSFREKLNAPPHSKYPPLDLYPHRLLIQSLLAWFIDVQSTTSKGSPRSFKLANGSPAATDTIGELKPLADMAKQSAVMSASPTNPLATLTRSAAALHLASSVDSSLLPPSTANPYTGAGAGAGAMVKPSAALGGVGENLAMPQLQSHSQTPNPLEAMLPQWPAAAPAMDGNAMSRHLPLLQLLSQQGISQDQWAAALQLVNITDTMGAGSPAQLPGFGAIPCQGSGGQGHPDVQNRVDRARRRDRDHSSSPPAGYGRPSHLPG